ncbi:MAG: ribosome assembly cofactor RimP [Bacteroidales bacterium]|nr:ribosome assembly cofactor RimP [Porphyromonas sp.]MDD6934371.1 ribosome assembly cofactor RimP [Bacteroidales bacterium]MDY3101954.1 ribosome assembly cofactor RimP [Porphyromonas sp.]
MKSTIREIVQTKLEEILDPQEEFVVTLSISAQNDIILVIDSLSGVSIDRCIAISKAIESALDRDKEDFSIEVGSASLSEPFSHRLQYTKHLGHPIVVFFSDGAKQKGVLSASDEEGFILQYEELIPSSDGRHSKRRYEQRERKILYSETKKVTYDFE